MATAPNRDPSSLGMKAAGLAGSAPTIARQMSFALSPGVTIAPLLT